MAVRGRRRRSPQRRSTSRVSSQLSQLYVLLLVVDQEDRAGAFPVGSGLFHRCPDPQPISADSRLQYAPHPVQQGVWGERLRQEPPPHLAGERPGELGVGVSGHVE